MKVLIFGASGFIGLPVAQAFIRKGYTVYGQTRNSSNIKTLEQNEIIPVIADPAKVEEWAPIVEKVDVVIECLGGMEVIRVICQTIFNGVCEAAKKARGTGIPKMTYIYCSGVFVHGDDRLELTSGRSPPKNMTRLVTWRPAQEQKILTSTQVDGIVIRPSLVYGRSGSVLSMLFGAALPGQELSWPGTKGGRWALVHIDDVADAFLRIAEAGPVCKGLVFDVSNDSSESVEDILEAVVRLSGAIGYTYREPRDVFEEAIAITPLIRPSLARSLVGWRPCKPSLVDGMKQYYMAWKAHQ